MANHPPMDPILLHGEKKLLRRASTRFALARPRQGQKRHARRLLALGLMAETPTRGLWITDAGYDWLDKHDVN